MKGLSACRLALVAVLSSGAADAVAKHRRHGNLWGLLVEDFEVGAHDPKKFEASCSTLIGKLLPQLRREYTSRQVPTVLYHECDVYNTRTDFHKKNLTVEVATWQCRHFAGSLVTEFEAKKQGDKDYKGWCNSFFDYLQEAVKSPKQREDERVKLLHEKEALENQLTDLHRQWKRERGRMAAKGAADWRKSEKTKEDAIQGELNHLKNELKEGGGPGESGFDDLDAHKLGKELDGLEDEWGLDEEEEGEEKERAPCCPAGCRMCEAEVPAKSAKKKAKKKGALLLQRSADAPQVRKLAAVEQRANASAIGFFGAVVSAFAKLPDEKQFVERCRKIISALMPKLQREYTYQNVGSVLDHDCDVYTTTTDFKVERMTLEHASWNCRHFAGQLAAVQGKNASYPVWCGDVFSFLKEEQDRKKNQGSEKSVHQLMHEKQQIQKQIDALHNQLKKTIGMPCCPKGCRICTL